MRKPMTAVKAIRAKCLDCTCQQPLEVRLCPVTKCALWPFRMGKRPKMGKEASTPHKAEAGMSQALSPLHLKRIVRSN